MGSVFVKKYELSSSIYMGVTSPGFTHLFIGCAVCWLYLYGEGQAHPGACQQLILESINNRCLNMINGLMLTNCQTFHFSLYCLYN